MLFTEKKQCCGCSACSNICPTGAIKMAEDEEGFRYPSVDTTLCINCKLCENVCQIRCDINKNNFNPPVYAAQNIDEDQRYNSTSGGIFPVLAQWVLGHNGLVYGVAYNENFEASHCRADNWEKAKKFVGSKYVQSNISDSYKSIKKDLMSGNYVLFTGTPCQVAGLKAFLGNFTTYKLLTCEILCHAVPSPLMWREHIKFIEKEKRKKIISYDHRPKIAGWHGHNEMYTLENGNRDYKSKLSQNHKDLFYAHLIVRPSCYECKYCGFPRVADVTIADFWGIEQSLPDFDDNKGTSLLILNTQFAEQIFEEIKSNLRVRSSSIEEAFRDNHKRPAKMNVRRDAFWDDYRKYGYEFVVKKYAGYSLTGRAKRQIKFFLKKCSKKIGIYVMLHKITQKKYSKEVYK